jgi:hypothetical protein
MACEFCTSVVDAFKLDSMENMDLGLLDKIIALDCSSCEVLRKRIQAATVERLENPDSDDEGGEEEELNYDKALLTLEVSKTTYCEAISFSVLHLGGISVWMLTQCLSW